ncbi:FYN-binding protein 1-like [Centroberyx gerrardi]
MTALEKNLSGGTATTTSSSCTPEPAFQRACKASPREDVGPSFLKPTLFKPKLAETRRESESSMPTPPRTPVMKPPVKATLSNKINMSPASAKPAWITNNGLASTPPAPKPPDVPKPKTSSMSSLQSQFSQSQEPSAPFIPKPLMSTNVKPPPPLAEQNSFLKQQSATDTIGVVKEGPRTLNPINSVSPKPPATQKPNFVGTSGTQHQPQRDSTDPSVPKKKSLPNLFALGNPPLKPTRPPNVDIHRFRGNGPSFNNGPGMKIPGPLAPLSTPQSNNCPPPPSSCPPSNHTTAMSQQLDQDESYDDVGVMNPPPIPPLEGHPAKKTEAEFGDEMYEDLDERWVEQQEKSKTSQDKKTGKEETKHSKVTKEKQAVSGVNKQSWNDQKPMETNNSVEMRGQDKKDKKEEKKQQQQEKKFQKAKEKREQEAKKKFKIKGPVCVIQKGKARLDCKGGKTDLPLKQGETIEIVRITENPEGRWLARTMEGYYGYVTTKSVDIDYDRLKQEAKTGLLSDWSGGDPEVYDDVGAQVDVCSGFEGQNVEDGDIYDDVDSPDQGIRFPPPPLPITDGDEVYDDTESQSFPPPPPLNNPPQLTPKGKPEVLDPKKQKKFEKEEKEFRKKFKFEGEIQVLYDVTVASTLMMTTKWESKDLQLKPGEVIDVIVKPIDGKLIGRNRKGKFGYVATAHVAQDTSDIYDDIGEDCIYDND